jgi:hypothetical protein
MPEQPVIVFDVNETLMDLETLLPTCDRLFSDPAAMRLWFANLITYSEALTLNGVYVPFTDIGGAVLRMLADAVASPSPAQTVPSSPTGSPPCRRTLKYPPRCAGSATMGSGCLRSPITRWRSPADSSSTRG